MHNRKIRRLALNLERHTSKVVQILGNGPVNQNAVGEQPGGAIRSMLRKISEPPPVADGRTPSGSRRRCRVSNALPQRGSGLQNVVDLERLVDLAEPFGAVGRTAAAALVERQLQLA